MDKKNNRVLGILIRSERISKGYSLRELGQKTNISHTLISNIEKGKMIPNNETLRDLFRELDIVFYDDAQMHQTFLDQSSKAINYIFTHDYEEARVIIDEMMKNDLKLTYSIDGVDYMILKGLFYVYVKERIGRIQMVFESYDSLIDFFTDDQKQLVYFIRGMLELHELHYKDATKHFELALSLGRKDRDVFVKEYLMKSLVKQYKFMDTYRLGVDVIKQFEDRTIYIRAMKTKLLLVDILYHIAKNDEVYDLTSNVLRFANKYNIPELFEECIAYHTLIDIRNRHFKRAEFQILKLPNQESDLAYQMRFKLAHAQDDSQQMEKCFNKLSKSKTFRNCKRDWNFLQVQAMSKISHLYNRKIYLELLQWLTDFSTKNNDQEMITLSYNYLIQFYHQERSYKKALEIADNLLHFKKIRIDNQI